MRLRELCAAVGLVAVLLAHASEALKAGVNVKFESLLIPGNKADSGEACDKGQGSCDPYFSVCFEPDCASPVKTGYMVDVDRVNFGGKIGNTANPIFVPISKIEDGAQGTIKVFDRNPDGTDMLLATRTFTARAKKLMDEGGSQSVSLGERGKVILRIRLTFSCAKGELDPVCSVCHRSNPCQNKGRCLPAGAGFECKCRTGYSGKVCENAAGQCTSEACPVGICRLGHGMPFCWCPDFRRGPKCEKQLLKSGVQVRFDSIIDTAGKLLDGKPCSSGDGCDLQFRVCVDRNPDTKKCMDRELLTDYFEGAKRKFHFGEAVGDKTKNPMFFQATTLSPYKKIPVEVQVLEHVAGGEPKPRASFKAFFTGSDVENDNSKDLTYTQNGITLKARVSFICDPALDAYPCEKEKADPCAKIECVHGKCVPDGEQAKCICDPGFEGNRCHLKKANPCDPNPCKNGGVCDAKEDGSFSCYCVGNFAGDTCEKNVCEPNPCKNGGVCEASRGKPTCSCFGKWTGETCETKKKVRSCDNSRCNNNGDCYYKRRRKACSCFANYHGRYCNEKGACADNPCKNGGVCKEDKSDYKKYTCECKKEFKGKNCEETAAKCKPGICGDHGKCAEDPANDSYKCNCDKGYEGKKCEEKTKYCPKTDACSGHGKCEEKHKEASYECKCDKGYEGKDCEEKTKYCKPDSCLNDGDCSEDHPNHGFKCKCKRGYEGRRCGKKVLYCPKSDACSGHGKCEEQHEKASYSCACDKGYEGRDCEEKTKYCPKSDACSGHGKCEERHADASYTCKCDKGYESKNCEKMTKYCKPDSCKNGGKCVEEHAKASFSCECKKGYEGESCEDKTKYCPETNPCTGHGKCEERHATGSYECKCDKGYEGKDCEDKTKYCKPDSCKNGGRCVEEHANAKFKCECGKGYGGHDCGEKTKYCPKKNVCSNHGQCVEMHKKADYRCACEKGYQGKDCEDKTKYCPKSNPCSGHGKCEEQHEKASYKCVCEKGYEGKDCEEETKYCPKTNACSGHGKCEEQHEEASYKCTCDKGYVGKDCEEKRKYCPAKDACSNHGTCEELHAEHSYKCKCDTGFEGKNCEKKKKVCREGLCENGGECVEDEENHSYKCKCKRGYRGRRCRKRVLYCPPVNACSGHGKCDERFKEGTYVCHCDAGYVGKECDKPRKYCKKDACKNGGLCLERHAERTFKCECAKGYEGNDCGTETKYCPEENACSGNGKCLEDHPNARHTCMCDDGFEGEECENAVPTTPSPACQPDTCANGGVCEEHNGSFRCKCKRGFRGRRCRRKKKTALCPEDACSGQGRCDTDGKSAQCHCNPGFAGKKCDRVITTTPTPSKLGEGYCLSLLLKQYSNEESKRIDGEYCDGNPFIRTLRYSACDVLFKICVSESVEKCQTTDFIKDKDVVTYGPMIGKTKNPLIYHLKKISEKIDIKVGAMDDDFSTSTDKIDDYEKNKMTRNLMKGERPITFTHKVGSLYAMAKIFCCDKEKCGSGPKPTGSRCLQITLIRFADPNGMRQDGGACDSFLGTTFSTSKCDPVFEVCVNDKCQKRSKAGHNTNELRYEQISKLAKPYVTQVSYQMKSVQLAVNVFEADSKSSDDVIARFRKAVDVGGRSGHVDFKSKFVTMRVAWQEIPCGSEPTCPPVDKVRECRNDGQGYVVMATSYEKQKDGSCKPTFTPGNEEGPCEPKKT